MHPGDIIAGKYRVAKVLGRSRGVLLEARHTEFDQRVVIRVMSPAQCNAKELEQFRREARSLSKLESEHVARIIDVGTHSDGSFFLARQFLEGADLATHIRNQGALRLDEAVLYVLQAAEAVQECHSNRIILRELQPSSLFLTSRRGGSAMVKLIDFGTAKLLKDPAGEVVNGEMTATVMFGLSPYSSPELLRKAKNIDARTDVWSMGCVLYELLAAVPPFQGEMAELMLKITRDNPLPLSSLRPDLPKEFDQIIGWALAKDISSRFSSMYAFAHALKPYTSAEGQVLIDRIGRVHHADPVQNAGPAISPTSPLAKSSAANLSALDSDDDSATVIRMAPSEAESDLEKTAFMGDVSQLPGLREADAMRGSVAPPRRTPPPPRHRPSQAPSSTGNFGALGTAAAAATSASVAPVNGTGSYPAMTSSAGAAATTRQRKAAVWAIGAALVLVPVIVLVLIFALQGDSEGQAKNDSSSDAADEVTAGSGDSQQAATATGAGGGAAVSGGNTGGSGVVAGTDPSTGAGTGVINSTGSGTVGPTTTGPTSNPTVTSEPPDDDGPPPPPPDDDDATDDPPPPPPPPPPDDSGSGKLVAIAIGGSCTFAVDGAGKGTSSSIRVTVPVGAHTVSCGNKGTTRTQRVTVQANKPGIATFRLN